MVRVRPGRRWKAGVAVGCVDLLSKTKTQKEGKQKI